MQFFVNLPGYLCRSIPIASFVLLAPGAAASQEPLADPDWSRAQMVDVKLSSFSFDPATITLQHGQVYDLKLDNTASGGHDFAAKAFFAGARIMDGDKARLSAGKVEVGGGQSVDIHLVAPGPGTYKVRCTHFLHAGFGMTGEIVVQ